MKTTTKVLLYCLDLGGPRFSLLFLISLPYGKVPINKKNKPKFNSAQLRFQPTSTAIATATATEVLLGYPCNTSIATATLVLQLQH